LGKGISRADAEKLAAFIKGADNDAFVNRAKAEMDDEEKARHARLTKENADLEASLERSAKRVGVDPAELEQVLATALHRALRCSMLRRVHQTLRLRRGSRGEGVRTS
jgi:hypothetical protein